MNAVIYLLVAAQAAFLGVRAWRPNRQDPLRRDFAFLCMVVALAYLSFSVHLFPGIELARLPYALFGAFIPAATLRFLEHFFARGSDEPSPALRRMWALTPVGVLAYLAAAAFVNKVPGTPGIAEAVFGPLVYLQFGVILGWLYRRQVNSSSRVERVRLRYLLAFAAGAVAFSGLEGITRFFLDLDEPIALWRRSSVFQGRLPPVGAVFTCLFLYFLHLVLSLERLMDLAEILSRLVSVAATAAVLVGVLDLGVLWVQYATGDSTHAWFHLFVACTIFLLGYDPLKTRIEAEAGRLLNVRGRKLADAMDELEEALPGVITLDRLGEVVCEPLHASGRVPSVALYLVDPERQVARLAGRRPVESEALLPSVGPHPFVDGFAEGEKTYVRQDLARKGDAGSARLRLMDGMGADVVIPIQSGEQVLGWLALRDEEGSDGFSHEELARLRRAMERAATVVENVKGFESVKEQARLAALGTMAAGLAHEIRNPLAGIKGAVQYLQTMEDVAPEPGEFLDIIENETDRLNVVVTSFLDYARPFELHRHPCDLNALVEGVLALVRAQGVPGQIELSVQLDRAIPTLDLDGDKLRQVLLNLVQNAVQALAKGGHVVVSTGFTRVKDKEAVEVVVADDGDGISKEVREKIFIPFFTTKPRGTGLGLPISQRIAEAHGGEIRVESRPGAGARFALILPLP